MKGAWISILLIAIAVCVGCDQASESYAFFLKGNIADSGAGHVLIQDVVTGDTLFRERVEKGDFNLKVCLPACGLYRVKLGGWSGMCLLDGENMTLRAVPGEFPDYVLESSPAEELKKEFHKILKDQYFPCYDSLNQIYKSLPKEKYGKQAYYDCLNDLLEYGEKRYELAKEFIASHVHSIYAAVLALEVMGSDPDKGNVLYAMLSEKIRNLPVGKQLRDRITLYEPTALGKSLPVFPVETASGEKKDFVWEKGMCVIDFWSSDCAPCRLEIGFMKKLYEEFHELGLEIVSVSMDSKTEAWLKANTEENLPWLSVRNADGFKDKGIRKAFGFSGIPFYVLLDKEGKIVGRNLRLHVLREKIMELLEDKS